MGCPWMSLEADLSPWVLAIAIALLYPLALTHPRKWTPQDSPGGSGHEWSHILSEWLGSLISGMGGVYDVTCKVFFKVVEGEGGHFSLPP